MSKISRLSSGVPRPPSAAPQAGFTLIEMVVAAFVMSVAMMIAAQVLLDTHRISAQARAELTSPDIELALSTMRRDIYGAASVRPLRRSLGQGFVLRGATDAGRGSVSYRIRDDRLHRIEFDRRGKVIRTAVVLREVRGFHWRALASNLIDLRLSVPRRRGPLSAGGSPLESVAFLAALRNRPASTW